MLATRKPMYYHVKRRSMDNMFNDTYINMYVHLYASSTVYSTDTQSM